jgi:hypothetical protein
MAARAAELPREVDQFPEFGELATWAMKTDALAERIKESSRH